MTNKCKEFWCEGKSDNCKLGRCKLKTKYCKIVCCTARWKTNYPHGKKSKGITKFFPNHKKKCKYFRN